MFQAQADIEFYLMKINRLQSDLSITQNELLAARLRLRTAQDYQIKYQLLLRQSQQESQRQKAIERQEQQKIAELIALKLQQRDQYWQDKLTKTEKDLNDKYLKEINKISQQFGTFRKKHEKYANKFDEQDLLVFKNKKLQKQVEVLQQKIDDIKKKYQRSKQAEIKLIKQTITQKNKQRQQNERKIYRQKIEELQKINSNLQFELLDARTRSDPNRQKQIQKLRAQLNLQIQKSNHELEQINQGLLQKNRQIEQLLNQKYQVQQGLIKQKRQLKYFIKTLEDKLYEKEREHQVQLVNLKQRMGKIRDEEAQGLKNQIYRIQQSFQIQRDSWIVVISDKDKQIQRIRNKFEEESQKNKDDKVKHLKKIDELKQKLKQYEGQKQAGQTEQLIKSMKDIAGKQQDFANYENGVTFLDRQLKKAVAKIQQKSIQITKLIKQLNDLRKQSQDQINSLRQKSRKDKKTYGDRILQLQQQIKDLNDQIRNKQRQFKRKQKEYQSKISHNLRQNQSLKDLIEEIQKDYTRAIQNKKAVQESYRQQRQRGITSKSDLTMVKKQKWLEMQKQKNELQVIYKQKQQQLRNKYEVQTDKIRHQRDDLKRQNQILRGTVQASKKDGEQNKQNKQAIYSEYHKKMASLNLQIALTKNIYDALIQAKSRKPRDSKVSQFEQGGSISQPNIEISSPPKDYSHQPYFGNYSDKQKLGLSFNPSRK